MLIFGPHSFAVTDLFLRDLRLVPGWGASRENEELASEMVTSRLSLPLGMESAGMVLGDGDTIWGQKLSSIRGEFKDTWDVKLKLGASRGVGYRMVVGFPLFLSFGDGAHLGR